MSSLVLKVQAFFHNLPLKAEDKILIALSGGMDSVVLADLALKVLGRNRLVLANFNHKLRPLDEQKAERALIESLVRHWQIPIIWGEAEGDLAGDAKERKESLENLARHARYAFLRQVQEQEGISYLATAHHADDQVETFLMRLMGRGSWSSLAGIREKGEWGLIRPLLGVFRAEIEAYAHENNLSFWEDSTNASLDFLRNSFRHRVIPTLNSVAPYAKDSLLDWQERLTELQNWVSPRLPKWEPLEDHLTLPLTDWEALPPFLQKEVFLAGAEELYRTGKLDQAPHFTAGFLDSLDQVKTLSNSEILLKGAGIELRIHKFSLILKALLVQKQEISYLLKVESCEWYSLPWGRISLETDGKTEWAIASFDRRWDFWRGTREKGKKFFSQWKQTRAEEICLVLEKGQIIALWHIEKSHLLWQTKNQQQKFKILADKGEYIGR